MENSTFFEPFPYKDKQNQFTGILYSLWAGPLDNDQKNLIIESEVTQNLSDEMKPLWKP